jgi:CheY-like chemotaxis protein
LYAEFEERLRFEMLLTELSARFASVTSESIDSEIVNAQRRIVQALDLDRSTLAQLADGERFVMTHTWHLPGLEPFPGFAVKDLPWMSRAMMRGEMVCFARIDDLPAEAVREKEIARRAALGLEPDLVVVDISMPVLNGFEAARRLKSFVSRTKVIFVTMHEDDAFVTEAVLAGALGYVLKSRISIDLIPAIRKVLRGHVFASPPLRVS